MCSITLIAPSFPRCGTKRYMSVLYSLSAQMLVRTAETMGELQPAPDPASCSQTCREMAGHLPFCTAICEKDWELLWETELLPLPCCCATELLPLADCWTTCPEPNVV